MHNPHLTPALLLIALLAGCGPQQESAMPAATHVPEPASAQPGTASPADLSAGRAKYMTMCAGCHGPKAEGIATYPKLAGQAAASLSGKLAKYRAGEKVGPMSGTMMPIARMLTETEVNQVAAYLGSL